MKYKVTFKEKGGSLYRPNSRTVYLSDRNTEIDIIDAFGLDRDDIEYYKIEKVEE